MINLDLPIKPLIRVVQPELNTFALQEHIDDFITENAQTNHYKGELVNGLHVTGHSKELSDDLASYLTKQRVANQNFQTKKGFFIDASLTDHHWVQAGHIIIDLTIRQFQNFPQLPEEILASLGQYAYFICDNPSDPIYQLYLEDLG